MPLVHVLADSGRSGLAWRPGLVALMCELGMEDEGRRVLRHVCAGGLIGIGRDPLRGGGLAYLADAAAALADVETAELVYPELARMEGRPLLVGYFVAFFGAADRYLGKLASTLGEWDLAERHFVAALDLNRRMGASLWVAHTRYEHACMLRSRAAPGDAERAAELLAAAGEAARVLELTALAASVAELDSTMPMQPVVPDDLSPRELTVLRLVARGLSNREIGEELVISEHTAANHIRSILRKTGCANRTEASAYAYRNELAGA
jgi:DNA-binding CsgD family transcriptional regulator